MTRKHVADEKPLTPEEQAEVQVFLDEVNRIGQYLSKHLSALNLDHDGVLAAIFACITIACRKHMRLACPEHANRAGFHEAIDNILDQMEASGLLKS